MVYLFEWQSRPEIDTEFAIKMSSDTNNKQNNKICAVFIFDSNIEHPVIIFASEVFYSHHFAKSIRVFLKNINCFYIFILQLLIFWNFPTLKRNKIRIILLFYSRHLQTLQNIFLKFSKTEKVKLESFYHFKVIICKFDQNIF